jgi:ABC-type multidrug transport system permease subunit
MDSNTVNASASPIVNEIIKQLMPYIIAGVSLLVTTIGTMISNMLHRTVSNSKVVVSNQAIINAIQVTQVPVTTQIDPSVKI